MNWSKKSKSITRTCWKTKAKGGRLKRPHSIRHNQRKPIMLNDQKTSAAIYKQLFTDAEWDAISSAMKDYADYGDEEANIADSIDAKISAIYNLTKWEFSLSPLLLSLVLILALSC